METPADRDRIAIISDGAIFVLGFPYDQDIPDNVSCENVYSFELDMVAPSWRYFEIIGREGRIAECVVIPQVPEGTPPTAALACLIRACSVDQRIMTLTDAGWRATPGTVVVVQDTVADGELALSLLERPRRLVGLGSLDPDTVTGFLIDDALGASIHERKATSIFLDALSVSTKKYRFLELYRSLERLFLLHVLEDLKNNFFMSPGDALAKAVKAVGNEKEALDNLIRQAAVSDRADAIRVEIEKLGGNRFAAALKRKFDKEPADFRSSANKGSAYLYYIRCAIVHAGSKDIIFEEFDDGDDVLDFIIPLLERLTLSTCGMVALETPPPQEA